MHNIEFECPACKLTVAISLSKTSSMVVMSCVHCKTPIMYYHGDVFEVDSIEIADLQQKHLKAVEGYLKVHDLKQTALGLRSISDDMPPATHQMGAAVRDTQISSEDIADLLIDLATATGVDDFLARM